jgi:hemerythrin
MMSDIATNSQFRSPPDYEIGVQDIDREHQDLFAFAEKIRMAIGAGEGKEVLEDCIDELIDTTCRLFTHEEEMMERIGYPYFHDHFLQHEDLRQRAIAMRLHLGSGGINVTIELTQFLVEWLKCHTTTSDRRIGTYMRKCGPVL